MMFVLIENLQCIFCSQYIAFDLAAVAYQEVKVFLEIFMFLQAIILIIATFFLSIFFLNLFLHVCEYYS